MRYYLVTQGSYSDYHVVGVTTDKKKAEALKEKINGRTNFYYNKAQIEEFDDKNIQLYLDDTCCYTVNVFDNGETEVFKTYLDLEIDREGITRSDYLNKYVVTMFEPDNFTRDKVVKIAYDKIAEYKARKQNI